MTMKNERVQNKSTTPSVHTSNSTTKKPQWQVVLDELYDNYYDGITSWDMITKHHITRTAAHIATLKKMGYDIKSVNETNNSVTYSRYFVIDEFYEIENQKDDDEREEADDFDDEWDYEPVSVDEFYNMKLSPADRGW